MWWLALAGYAVPMIGGVVWSGRRYALLSLENQSLTDDEREEEWGVYLEHSAQTRIAEGTLFRITASTFWPIALAAVVLYYVIASPFLIGKHLGRREAERKVALRDKYTEQADYLRLLAEDEDDSTMQEILRSGADALVQQAKEL